MFINGFMFGLGFFVATYLVLLVLLAIGTSDTYLKLRGKIK